MTSPKRDPKMAQWPTAKGTTREDRIKHLNEHGEYIAAARAYLGPVALGVVCGLEANHRLTGTSRVALATMSVSETVFALIVVKEAERQVAAAESKKAYEKFAKAKAEDAEMRAALRSEGAEMRAAAPQVSLATAGETEALKREHELMRQRLKGRSKGNRTKH